MPEAPWILELNRGNIYVNLCKSISDSRYILDARPSKFNPVLRFNYSNNFDNSPNRAEFDNMDIVKWHSDLYHLTSWVSPPINGACIFQTVRLAFLCLFREFYYFISFAHRIHWVFTLGESNPSYIRIFLYYCAPINSNSAGAILIFEITVEQCKI